MRPFSLDEYLKNPSRKVITRDGRNVKILCTNYYLGNQCVIAEVVDIDRSFSFNQYGVQIGTNGNSPLDLFFITEEHEGWINLYKCENSTKCYTSNPYDSEEKAIELGKMSDNYLKTIKIEWEA